MKTFQLYNKLSKIFRYRIFLSIIIQTGGMNKQLCLKTGFHLVSDISNHNYAKYALF